MSVQTPPSTTEEGRPPLSLPAPKKQKLLAPPPKKSRFWLWLLIFIALGAAVYEFVVVPRLKTDQTANAPGGKGGGKKGGGVIPVVAARAKSGPIGVYYSGLGVVTPIYTVLVRSRVDG